MTNDANQIEIVPIPAFSDNYMWAIVDTKTGRTLIIDPGEAHPVIDFLEKNKLTLAAILITHHHHDHTGGITALISRYPIPVIGPLNDGVTSLTKKVNEPDEITITNFPLTFSVLAIPGHTKGHIAYYAKGMLFCGDTLFAGGCGRLFEGTAAQLYHSLQKIAALPDDTKIYCAHEYTVKNLQFAALVEPENSEIQSRLQKVKTLRENNLPTLPSLLSEEMATNPFLRCHQTSVKSSLENHAGKQLADKIEIFAELRQWKDRF